MTIISPISPGGGGGKVNAGVADGGGKRKSKLWIYKSISSPICGIESFMSGMIGGAIKPASVRGSLSHAVE